MNRDAKILKMNVAGFVKSKEKKIWRTESDLAKITDRDDVNSNLEIGIEISDSLVSLT